MGTPGETPSGFQRSSKTLRSPVEEGPKKTFWEVGDPKADTNSTDKGPFSGEGEQSKPLAPIFGKYLSALATPIKRKAVEEADGSTHFKKGKPDQALPIFWRNLIEEVNRLETLIEEQATVKRETKFVMKEVKRMVKEIQEGKAPCFKDHTEVNRDFKQAHQEAEAKRNHIEKMKDILKQAAAGTNWTEAISLDWPKALYLNTHQDIRKNIKTNGCFSVVLTDAVNLQADPNYRKLLYHAPEFKRFTAEEIKEKGHVVVKKHTRSIVDDEEVQSEATYILMTQTTMDHRKTAHDIIKACSEAKLVAVFPNNQEAAALQKALEIATHGTVTNIAVRVPNPQTNKPKTTQTHSTTVLVSSNGKSFAEVVKAVKSGVDSKTCGVEVVSIRDADNKVAIRVRGGRENANILKQAIAANKELETTIKRSTAIFHIYDMEQTVTPEEIKDAINSLPGTADTEDIEITSVRPSRSGGTNATVRVSTEVAKSIDEIKSIKIGWLRCRIARRQPNTNCTKCWRPGHKFWSCSGPDRSNLCFNCGKSGHNRADCKDAPYCPVCNTKGHRFNERSCK